jgi:hypothetical protein
LNQIRKNPLTGALVRRTALIALPCLLFLFFYELFLLRAPHIFIGFDGGYTLELALRQLRSGSEWHALNGDFQSSLGDIFHPANFKLFPSFWLLYWIRDVDSAKAATLSAILLEVLFAGYLFARTAGLSRSLAIAASALLCVCLFPFHGVGYVFSLVPLVPQIGTSIAVALLMVVCFARFGQATAREDWPWAAAFLALLAWCVFAIIPILLIASCLLAFATVGTCLFAASKQEKARKASLLGIAAILFCGLGPALFFAGILMDSVASLFPGELEDNVTRRASVSIFFHYASYGIVGPVLVVSAALGALWSAFKGGRTERIFAGALLLFFALLGATSLAIYLTRTWRGPAPLYLEIAVIPLYAVFAVRLVSRSFDLIAGIAGRVLPVLRRLTIPGLEILIACVAVAFPAYLVLTERSGDYGRTYPPRRSPIIDILETEIALHKGDQFRGRVATLTGRSIATPVGWIDLYGADASRADAIGNEHRVTGLNYFRIPNLFPYGPTLSPGFYLMSRALLARPEDRPMRNVTVLRKIDSKALGMMGVRYVITDAESDQPVALRHRIRSGASESLLLYEIDKVNVGQFSPTVPLLAGSIDEAFRRLKAPEFDPRESFVIHDALAGTAALLRARDASLLFEGPSLRFRASSDGRSVVLLPLNYSLCLDVETLEGRAPRIFRANVALTGILFEKQIEVRLLTRTGPISKPGCLLADRNDLLNVLGRNRP